MSRPQRRTARTTRRRATARPNATLTRERVVAAALELLDREGQAAFSLRRLAEHLGVTPMALYNHVESRHDLLAAVAASVIDSIAWPTEAAEWQERIAGTFRALRGACLAHPGAVPLVQSADHLPASIFRPMEITIGALRSAGLGAADAARAYYLLVTFTIGQVGYQIEGWSRGVDPASAVKEGQLTSRDFPNVAGASVGAWDFDASFEFGLSTILAGLASRFDGAAGPPTPA